MDAPSDIRSFFKSLFLDNRPTDVQYADGFEKRHSCPLLYLVLCELLEIFACWPQNSVKLFTVVTFWLLVNTNVIRIVWW